MSYDYIRLIDLAWHGMGSVSDVGGIRYIFLCLIST